MTNNLIVMTSGAFTAAYIALIPKLEAFTKRNFITAATSIGSGQTSIPNRLKSGEAADIIIVADKVMHELIKDGLVRKETYSQLVRSAIGMATGANTIIPEIKTTGDLKEVLIKAKSIAYSASVSGNYLINDLLPRLGIKDQVMHKSILVDGGERVGAVVARGQAEIGFQQISELLAINGIANIKLLPTEIQYFSVFSTAVATSSKNPELAAKVINYFS